MEASVVLNILVRQVVTMPPELGIGFTELSHQISIEEGIKEGTVIKVFELDHVFMPPPPPLHYQHRHIYRWYTYGVTYSEIRFSSAKFGSRTHGIENLKKYHMI